MTNTGVAYYKISEDGSSSNGSSTDYNVKYDKDSNTLTVNGFAYNGNKIGIYANGDLKIAVVGDNTITSTDYAIRATGNLTISGTNRNSDKLSATSSGTDAIFAYDPYQAYNESIHISDVEIEALSEASVGICAPYMVTITDSHVVSTGKAHGIQGGYFAESEGGNGNRGNINITGSYVKAEAKSTVPDAQALKGDVTVKSGGYSINTRNLVEIKDVHEHYLCGMDCKVIGDHQTEESKITFNKKIWMDGETLKIDDAAWTKDTTSNVERYKLPEGSYYLDDNIELEASILTEGSVNLCLNGYTITAAAQGAAITVGNGSKFALTDCRIGDEQGSITHKNRVLGKGVYNSGEFFLYGGNITGNDSDSSKTNFNGGGVTNHNGATFIMYGGSITGNKATSGAGVYNSAQDTYPTKDTVFKMYGGTISGNQASYMGGGVLNQGDFTMQGGSIGGTEDSEKNTARIGGGVHISSQWASTAGTFTMEAGKIVGNTATENGGGVFVEVKDDGTLTGTFHVSGNVAIAGNKSNGKDDNVYLEKSTDEKTLASITITSPLTASQKIGVTTAKKPTAGNPIVIATKASNNDASHFVSDDSDYEVAYGADGKLVLKKNLNPEPAHSHYLCGTTHTEVGDHTSDPKTQFTAWTSTSSLPNKAGNYYLTEDVTLTTAVGYSSKISGSDYCGWDVPDGVVLCLNGKTITMQNPADMTDDVDVIKVSGQFTLTDCKTGDAQGKITHAIDTATNNKYKGRGVKVLGGTFHMFGGIITGNTSAYDTGGSGVCVTGHERNTSVFRLYGGQISENTAKNGGGVTVSKYVDEAATRFDMYGGRITNNAADSTWPGYGNGGGVYVSWTTQFVMNGGIISQNRASNLGGGVYASALARYNDHDTGKAADLDISGTATITGNKAGNKDNNVFLTSHTADNQYETVSATLTIREPLTGIIGITTKDLPTDGSPVVIATGAAADKDYSAYIKSDNTDYVIAHDSADATKLVLQKPSSGSGTSSGGSGGGASASTPTPAAPEVITVKEETKDNSISKPGTETGTTTTTKTTVKNTTTATSKNEQGQDVSKTTASVSKDLGDKLLDQAVSNNSDTIEITVKSKDANSGGNAGSGTAGSVKSTEVELPKATVDAIAKDTNADLVIKTDNGELVLDNKTLETISDAAKGDTVTIEVNENMQLKETQKPAEKIVGKNGSLFDFVAKIGERSLHRFEGGKAYVTLPMPDKLKGKDVLVIYIDDNGLCKILNHSVEKIGAYDYVRFMTTHFSTFAVVEKDEAEQLIKEQNAAHVKELIQHAKFRVSTTKTSKRNVKVQVTVKTSKTLISDIKSLGYTVKYQFYRSTKKTAGYKAVKTKTTNTYVNTKGTKGTKYYYKTRVLVYDGKTLVAKSTRKQCSWGTRVWSK